MRRNKPPLAPDSAVIAETTRQLNSELLKNYSYTDPSAKLDEIKASGHRKVCQYQFQKNDIVWICRECQSDDTCVLCNECFQGSDHTGHSVYFYHSQSGGCCDCGDCSSWDPKGFCHRHGVDISDPIESVPLPLKSAAISLTSRLVGEIVEFMSYFKPDFRQEDGENTSDGICLSVLLLHNDDVHSIEQVQSALRACGIDRNTASKFTDDTHEDGHSLIDTGIRSEVKGKMLMIHSNCVLSCRIIPSVIWDSRDRIIAKINWLREIALLSDGLCRIICSNFSIETLVQLMQSDAACNRYILKHLHNMYLSLMADNVFKMAFSIAYGKSYDSIMTAQESGITCNDCALTSLSVQFLNRMSCVNYLVEKLNLFDSVANTLSRMLIKQGSPSNQLSSNIILTNRRFMAALADVKIVFAISGMSRRYMSHGLSKLLDVLTHYQWMHPQERYTTSHIEYESRDWMTAFNVYIGLFSLMETLLNWTEDSASAQMTYKPDCNLAEGCSADILAAFPELFTVIHREHSQSDETEESLAFLDCRSPDFREMLPSVLCVLNNCTYRIQAWAAKDWQKIQQSAVKSMSFHLPLHRFYGRVFSESCTESHLTNTVTRHIRYLQNDAIEMMDVKSSLAQFIIEPALTSMSFASQIRVGMWRRNGTVMMDQALNYSETPFCSSFRDMDLLLTQIGCAAIGSKSVLRTAIDIFGMRPIFESKTLSHISMSLSPSSSSSSFEAALLDEFLIMLIWMISEGPRQPTEGQLESRLRRAIIHGLASADKPFSKLVEELSYIAKFHDIDTAVIRKVVNDVAESKSLNSLAMEAPKFSLRSEAWAEYDPCFPWISRSSHQVVIGIRPQAKKTRAMVIAPQPCHEFYRSVPSEILSDDLVLNLCRKAVLATLHDLTLKSTTQTSQPHIYNFTIFSRVVQILTLACHVFTAEASEGNEHGHEECRRKFIAFLKEYVPRQIATETIEQDTASSPSSTCNLMEALLDLKKHFAGMIESLSEKENLYFVQWIIEKFASLDSELSQMVAVRTSTTGKGTSAKKAAKAAKYQQSLMKSMEAAASSFKDMNIGEEEQMMRDIEHDQDEEDELELEEHRDDVECNLTCVVCQQEGHEDLAFFGFSQASKLYIRSKNYCDVRLTESPTEEKLTADEIEQLEPCKLHFSLCGHSIHFECFGEFFANMVYRSESQGYLLLDTSRDQFTCPLCKRISNCLFPHDAQSLRKRKKIKSNSIGNEMEARKAPSRESSAQQQESLSMSQESNTSPMTNYYMNNMTDNSRETSYSSIASDQQQSEVIMCANDLDIPLDICRVLSSSTSAGSPTENTGQFLLSRRFFVGLYEPLGLTSHHGIFAVKLVESIERTNNSTSNNNNNNNNSNSNSNNSHVTVLRCEPAFAAAFEGILNGLSHTLSCYESENGDWMPIEGVCTTSISNNGTSDDHNSSSSSSSGGVDDLRFFPLMIAGLSSAIRHLNLANLIESRFFHDALLNENNISVESDMSFSRNYRTQWLHSQIPLLALPLLDAIIAIAALSNLGNHLVFIDFKYGVVKYSQWIIVAHITQLIIDEMHNNDNEDNEDDDSDNNNVSMEDESCPNFNELESFFPLLLEMESMVRSRSFMVLTNHLPPLLTKSQWRHILWRLCTFIRCVSLLLNRLKLLHRSVSNGNNTNAGSTRKPRYANQLTLAMIQETLKLVEMDTFLVNNREKVLMTSSRWTINFYEYMATPPLLTPSLSMPMNTLKQSLQGPFPICAPLLLLPRLEPSYTKLHSMLTRSTGMESPAICLCCGLVLDAKGGGKITKHFRMCSGETGAAFLLQDCYLLLSFGPRACYFPSIYVDEFGEKHQINRGKPLFLDPKRFEIFRKIFAQMKVATEVTDKRSNSNRVIIMNFF